MRHWWHWDCHQGSPREKRKLSWDELHHTFRHGVITFPIADGSPHTSHAPTECDEDSEERQEREITSVPEIVSRCIDRYMSSGLGMVSVMKGYTDDGILRGWDVVNVDDSEDDEL